MSDKTTAEDVRAILEEGQNVPEEGEAPQPETETEPEPEKAEEPSEPGESPEEPEEEPDSEPKEETEQAKPKPQRKSKYVPVSKANAWRHEAAEAKRKAAELEAELKEVRESKSKEDISSTAERIAKEHNVSAEAVRAILEASTASRPAKEIEELMSLKASIQDQAEEAAYRKELGETLEKYPELKGYESDLRELAYSEGNEKVPLRLLALQLKEELNLSPKPPSGEKKGAQAKPSGKPNFSEMSEQEILSLEGKDLDEYIEWQKTGFRKRTGVR